MADWNRLVEMAPRELADILTAALFVGSSMIWSSGAPPVLGGVPVFGVLGCVVAVFMGLLLAPAIKRSGGSIESD